ncbi:MAG: DsrE family protein [Gammaproteobacteria bacterium]|nr:DsrE family protein [Gammaproteobacteria bacterium]MDH5659666.1 DsrE family protein [Gammaproteobacteria bacterium]
MKKIYFPLVLVFSLLLTACELSGEDGLKQILSSEQAPAGVVFDVATADKEGLNWVVPMVKSYSRQLRNKFPGVKLALVSHGAEQFQLTQSNIQRYINVHRKVKGLIDKEEIQFHICAYNASQSGVKRSAFVTYVDLVDRGPEQISKYQQQGYVVLSLIKQE